MKRVRVYQLDGPLPNVALMRVAAHHRRRGDVVELRRAGNREAVCRDFGEQPDLVYASLIFERTRPVAEELRRQWPNALIGGTGWTETHTLEDHGIDTLEQDYSIYPRYENSIGFLQRGCRLRCPFCVVPKKEGAMRHEQTVDELWRGGTAPRRVVLLDNDFFGNPEWKRRIEELRDGKFKVAFSQGINARFLTPETAEAIASVDYRANDMKVRRVYTAWDSLGDERRLMRGLEHLRTAGVSPGHVMVYMLIGYWAGETHVDRERRRTKLREFGAKPYPMPYVRTPELVGYQRWVLGGYDNGRDPVTWSEWVAAGMNPRKLKRGRHRSLQVPLFDAAPHDRPRRHLKIFDEGRSE